MSPSRPLDHLKDLMPNLFYRRHVCKIWKRLCKICRHKGLCDEADTAQKAIEQMEKTVMDAGWDGEWYLRAYDHYKHKIGSKECEDGKSLLSHRAFVLSLKSERMKGSALRQCSLLKIS